MIAFVLGADTVNVGREAMLALGCIQTQKCHTDRCPTGVTTQSPWLTRGLDPALKSVRAANYVKTLRRDLLKVSEACGSNTQGSSMPTLSSFSTPQPPPIRNGSCSATRLTGRVRHRPIAATIIALMSGTEPRGASAPPSHTATG